ncbi:efflux RND transporter periplasmic adaptor subunit [Photobacterium kishitanii]|uniref:efflux RND transporter periplasmic adaptor subunit n=1 Tax=Photobacterium kishitanii TaxID=318456 RepID=UPI0027397CC4|nr:efflux RND transporter periplasmic adaptor subunit [Photobacterium kishitanii]
MVARGKHLYRPEYFEAQKVTSQGRILLNASFNQNIYLCLSMLVLIAIVTFITLAEYTRRETLVGLVSPLEGMVKVQANDSGYIEQIFVKEGDKVENLTPLYEIKTERFDDSGIAVKQRILVSIENQYQLLVERRQQESVKANLDRQALVEDITRLDIESGILKNLLKLSNHELKLTHLLANKQKTLLKNHFLSDYDYQKIQLDLLSKQSKTESHNLNLQKLLREKQNRITSLKK